VIKPKVRYETVATVTSPPFILKKKKSLKMG